MSNDEITHVFLLQPPVPADEIDFVRVFDTSAPPGVAAKLTQLRTAMMADATTLVRSDTDTARALECIRQLIVSSDAYRRAFADFADTYIHSAGTRNGHQRRRPVARFAWHDRLLAAADARTRTVVDPSTAYEQAAVTLVLVAALQRQASMDQSLLALNRAIELVDELVDDVLAARVRPLVPLVANSNEREPRLLDATFVRALGQALRGQRAHVAATSVESGTVASVVASWMAYERFRRARTLACAESTYARAAARARVRALEMTAALVRTRVDRRETFGLVVALERERVLADDDMTCASAAAAYALALDDNRRVYDRARVPPGNTLVVEMVPPVSADTATDWHIDETTVHLTSSLVDTRHRIQVVD